MKDLPVFDVNAPLYLPTLRPPAKHRRAFLYCRVSSREQVDRDCSLPLQAQLCREKAESLGVPVTTHTGNSGVPGVWFDSAVSAWKTAMPLRRGFRHMWKHMRQNDLVIMLDFYRGWRKVNDFVQCYQEMLRSGIEVQFVDGSLGFGTARDSPMTRFILTGQANLSELKSEITSERMKESWRERKLAKARCTDGDPKEVVAADNECASTRSKLTLSNGGTKWGAAFRQIQDEREDQMPPSGRAFGYARVSGSDQTPIWQQQFVSRKMKEQCDKRGWQEMSMFVDDGVSAYRTKWFERPAGRQLWNNLIAGDHVFILAADRAFRSILDMSECMQELEQKGVILHFLRDNVNTGTKDGVRLLQMLSLAAQWESEDISRRVKITYRRRQEEVGQWIGGLCTPYWLAEIPDKKTRGIIWVPDSENIDRLMQVVQMVRDRGKKPWKKFTAEVENILAEQDGRLPVLQGGVDLTWYRRKSKEAGMSDQGKRFVYRAARVRRFDENGRKILPKGKTGRSGNQVHPEFSTTSLREVEEKIWNPLLRYVAVKPALFGEQREAILQVG